MYNEMTDSQILLAYCASCKGESILKWLDLLEYKIFYCSPNTIYWVLFMTTFIVMLCDILSQIGFGQKVKHKSWAELRWHSVTW